MQILGVEKNEEFPKYRLVLGDRKLALWCIVSQELLKGSSTGVKTSIHRDLESQTSFPKSLKH